MRKIQNDPPSEKVCIVWYAMGHTSLRTTRLWRSIPAVSVSDQKRGEQTMKDDQKPARTDPQARKEDQPAQSRKKEQKKSEQTRS